jgi:translocation and assembly module TamA
MKVRAITLGLLLAFSLLQLSGCAKSRGRPWIHKIRIEGAKQVKPREIRGKLAMQQASIIPFSSKNYLEHPYIVQVDRERIETYYRARGFYSARVTEAEVVPYKTGKKPAVDIRYVVEEGLPTYIRKLDVTGVDALGEDAAFVQRGLKKIEALTPGRRFEHPEYMLAKDLVMRLLHVRGYAFAKLNWEVEVNREQRIADISLQVEPGNKMRIGNTLVEGAQRIPPAAVAKHAALFQGDRYKPQLIDGAQGKLYNLGVFTTVLVEPVKNPNDPSLADVRIRVAEGKFREINLGVGFGIEPLRTEVHAEATFIKRSFFGGLRKLELGLRPGYAAVPAFWSSDLYRHGPLISMKAEFTQPDLLGRNSQFSLGVVYDLGLEYAYQYHGPALRTGVQKNYFRDRLKLAASYNFQFLDFFETDPAILNDPGAATSFYGYVDPYRLAYLQEQIVLDLRNRPIDATRGFLAGVMAEQGCIYTGSAFNYQKRVQFGQIFTQGELGSPITQRLYLGGPNSHRGFSYNRLSHQVCSARAEESILPTKVSCLDLYNNPDLLDGRSLPIGGDQMLLAQLETRVNLFKLFGQWFSMAAFADAGDVAAPTFTNCDKTNCPVVPYLSAIDLRRLHVAVGGGLRYRTVVGAIRFDLGVRLNRLDFYENDGLENPDPGQRIAYHISIGEAF